MAKDEEGKGLQRIGDVMRKGPAELRPPSPQMIRMVEASAAIRSGQDDQEIAYHHTVFCQTALPYREVEEPTRKQTRHRLPLAYKIPGMVLPGPQD